MAASADPGQLTLFVGTVGNVTLLPNILSSYNIDPLRDFRPVTQLTVTPDVLIVHAGIAIPHGSWAGALMPAATSDEDVEN